MAKYKDIDFSFSRNPFTGDLNLVYDGNSIKQSLKNIIFTLKGEKSFNYMFGGAVQNILFEYGNDTSITVLNDIDSAIRINEPRITLKNISLDASGSEATIVIEYDYTIETGETVTEITTVTTS